MTFLLAEMVEVFAIEFVTRESVGKSPLMIVKKHTRDSYHHTGKYCPLYELGLLY